MLSHCFSRFLRPAALLFVVFGALVAGVAAQPARPPVIIIPGLAGSELVNRETREVVWFKLGRSRRDDLRLPISADLAASRDALEPRDILRRARVGFAEANVYDGLIEFFEKRGYREATWNAPQAENSVYVFAYDWRRDNVENARRLVRLIETAKKRLGRPDLKFDVVAHSMGGLIARYAAMYGDRELPAADPRPDWAGAAHFNKIVLLGTPNEGSILAINSLVNGFTPLGLKLNLPFVQNITRFDIFTIQSVYQLLPRAGRLRAFDENLRPIEVDLYDPQTWDRFGWNPLADRRFARQFDEAERREARAFFVAALERARRFQAALAALAAPESKPAVAFRLAGADCKRTLDGVIIRRNGDAYVTQFDADDFRRGDGRRATAAEIKKLLFAPGDGIVAKRSLTSGGDGESLGRTMLRCEGHNFLTGSRAIQNDIAEALN